MTIMIPLLGPRRARVETWGSEACAKARFQCRLIENRACTDSRPFASDRSVQHTGGGGEPCSSVQVEYLRLHISRVKGMI